MNRRLSSISIFHLLVALATLTSGEGCSGGGAGGSGGNGGSSGGSSSGGGTASGGAGGAAPFCTPGETRACYSGPASTQGVGVCTAGVETCNAEGSAFGPCAGEVTPKPEDCSTPANESCAPSCGATRWATRLGTEADNFVAKVATGGGKDVVIGWLPGGGGATITKLDGDGKELWTKNGLTGLADLDVDAAGTIVYLEPEEGFPHGRISPDGVTIETSSSFLEGRGYGIAVHRTESTIHTTGMATSKPPNDKHRIFIDSSRYGKDLISGTTVEAGWRIGLDGNGEPIVTCISQQTNTPVAPIDFGTGPTFGQLFVVKPGKWATGFPDAYVLGGGFPSVNMAVAADGSVALSTYAPEGGTKAADFGTGFLMGGVIVVRLDASGKLLWAKDFGPTAKNTLAAAPAIAFDGAGNLVVAGAFTDDVDFGGGALHSAGSADAFVAMLDVAGNHVFSRSIGGKYFDAATAVAVDADGDILVAGSFSDTVDFGAGTLTTTGLLDVFVAKLAR